MTVYKDLENLNRIIRYTPKDWGIYIHIDKKSKINIKDVDKRAKVFKIKKIYWAGWEHLWTFHFLLEKAFKSGIDYDYYHLITGQDFYAQSVQNFDSIVGSEGYNYMGIFKLPNYQWNWGYGLDIFKYRTLASYCDIRVSPMRYVNSCFKYIQKYTHTYRSIPDIPLYGGPVYSSFTKDFIAWMLQSDLAKYLLKRLKYSSCSEEVFFATVIMNSPFKQSVRINKTLRYVDWHSSPRPKYLEESDYHKIINSNSLFCRKVDSCLSKDLISKLEILQREVL